MSGPFQAFRTNRVGAEIRFQVSATSVVGLDFGSEYQANLENEPNVRLQLPRITYKVFVSGTESAARWSPAVPADGRVIMATALDPAKSYTVVVRVQEVGNIITTPNRASLVKTERFREPEEGLPSQYGPNRDQVEGFGPSGGFVEITNLVVSSEATVTEAPFRFPATLKVLVYSDLHADGYMLTVPTTREGPAQTRVADAANKDYIRLACEGAAKYLSPKRNLVYTNLSYRYQFVHRFDFPQTILGAARYANTDAFKAGFATNPATGAQIDGAEWQSFPGFLTEDNANQDPLNNNGPIGPAMFDRLTETRLLAPEFVPDVVIIALGTGTQQLREVGAAFAGTVAVDSGTLILDIRSKWPGTPFVVVSPYRGGTEYPSLLNPAQNEEPVYDGLLTAVTVLTGNPIAAADLNFVDLRTAAAAAPDNLGDFGIVLTEAQHAYLATTLQSALETTLDNATSLNPGAPSYDFSVDTNSQYVATF